MCYKGNVPGEVEWKHLHIPHTYLDILTFFTSLAHASLKRHRYLLDNWPMKFAAMSRDGTQIAVTGRRGLILYNNTTGRWKMFGDRNQEQEIVSFSCSFHHKHSNIMHEVEQAKMTPVDMLSLVLVQAHCSSCKSQRNYWQVRTATLP